MHKAPRYAPFLVMLILIGVFVAFLVSRASGSGGVIRASGTIEWQEVRVSPEVAGRLTEVLVDEGARVKAGDTLVTLDHRVLDAQRAQAEAAFHVAEANARAAQANLEALEAGPTEEQLRVAQAGVAQAQLALDFARQTYDDLPEGLRETANGKALQQQVARAVLALEAAQAQYDLVRAGARPEQIRAAREQAAAAGAQVDSARAALALLDAQMEKYTLTSPVDGIVLTRGFQPGEFAAPGSVILTLGREGSLTLTVYVPETDLGRITPGQKVEVRVDSFPGEVFHGTVLSISDRAEFTPRNVQTQASRTSTVFAVRLTLDDDGMKLKAGMPADVEFK